MIKILLVEDDKSLREIYGVRLLAEGYDILSAGDGEEALAIAIKNQPALIISDVMMPKVSGFDMLDILRSTTETRDIKVIMMTALSSESQRQRGEALGADRYLVKSQVGIEDVVQTVHEVLNDRTEVATQAPAVAAPVQPETPAPASNPAQSAVEMQSSGFIETPLTKPMPLPEKPVQPTNNTEAVQFGPQQTPEAILPTQEAYIETPGQTQEPTTVSQPVFDQPQIQTPAQDQPTTNAVPDNSIVQQPSTEPQVTTEYTPVAESTPQPLMPSEPMPDSVEQISPDLTQQEQPPVQSQAMPTANQFEQSQTPLGEPTQPQQPAPIAPQEAPTLPQENNIAAPPNPTPIEPTPQENTSSKLSERVIEPIQRDAASIPQDMSGRLAQELNEQPTFGSNTPTPPNSIGQ